MVKKLLKILLVLALAGVAVWGVRLLFPGDEARIRRNLEELSELATFTGREGNFKRVANANGLSEHFATNAEIAINVPGSGVGTLNGRGEIRQRAFAAMTQGRAFQVQFYDINIVVADDQRTATAEMTAKIAPGDGDFIVQELRFHMSKADSGWVIERIETMQTFQ